MDTRLLYFDKITDFRMNSAEDIFSTIEIYNSKGSNKKRVNSLIGETEILKKTFSKSKVRSAYFLNTTFLIWVEKPM